MNSLTPATLGDCTNSVPDIAGFTTREMSHLMDPVLSAKPKARYIDRLTGFMEAICEVMQADGCVLWGVARGSNLDPENPHGRLFTIASSFPKIRDPFTMDSLPMGSSCVGHALVHRRIVSGSPETLPHPMPQSDFMRKHDITRMCAVPMFARKDEERLPDGGVLAVYRSTNKRQNFSEREQGLVEHLATMLPGIYDSIMNERRLHLISMVAMIFRYAERDSPGGPTNKAFARRILDTVCRAVRKAFHANEVTLFLVEHENPKANWVLMGTTWRRVDELKGLYSRENDCKPGLTGWVLKHNHPIIVSDLSKWSEDRDYYQKMYPGADWANSLNMNWQTVPQIGPPSFLAVPVSLTEKGGNRNKPEAQIEVLGAMRCTASSGAPHHYSTKDAQILQQVAGRVGRAWQGWLRMWHVSEEANMLNRLVHSLSDLNAEVVKELESDDPNEERILSKVINAVIKTVTGARPVTIRFWNKEKGLLELKCVSEDLDQNATQKLRERIVQVGNEVGACPSFMDKALHGGKVIPLQDVSTRDDSKNLLPDVKSIICAPIRLSLPLETAPKGVLSVGFKDTPSHWAFAITLTELIGHQLAIYIEMTEMVGALRKAQSDLRAEKEFQANAAQDLRHQMRSPLNSALFRLQKLIAPLSESQEFAQLLFPIRGLIRKARLVSESMGLLARFEQNLPIQLKLLSIDSNWLRRLLVEAGRDAKFGTSSPSKRISFRIAQDFPSNIDWPRYQVDEELLAQAMQTIFDNAAKYSYSNTEAWTRVQVGTNDALQIIVESTGIPVTPEDSTRATERGYRSPKAKQTTGEGTGIGLWLVSHIMKAHKGSFELMPSNSSNLTSAIITLPPSI